MPGTLIELAEWWATERADETAIVLGDDRVTYKELHEWANTVSDWLRGEGLEPGDRVTTLAANSIEWLVLSQALMYAGAIVAPLNPRFTQSEVNYIVGERYRPKFVFFDPPREALAQAAVATVSGARAEPMEVINVLRGQQRPSAVRANVITADTRVVIIPTSGSTAFPKGVVYTHRSVVSYITQFAVAEPAATDRARILLFAPMCTASGYVVSQQFLSCGGTVYIDIAFDASRALQTLIRERISVLMGTPIFLERMAACPEFADADLSCVRLCIVGGAPVSQKLLQTWLGKGVLIRQLYGQTEAGGLATINTLEGSRQFPEKCGRGMPFTRVAIVDEQDQFCPPNTLGEIVLKGPANMLEYWNDAEATAKAYRNGWLHTSDLGMVDENGLLTMVDRIKDIIISGGLNISAAEVERIVTEASGADEVAVIAAHDDKFGETPMAVIHSSKPVDVPAIIRYCNQHLSDYKVPRYIAVESEPLPRLATGKIAKPALRSRYADAHLRLQRVR